MSDEIETFEGLLEGDGFIIEEAKEEEAARKRRLKRKRRLEALQKSQKSEPLVLNVSAKKPPMKKPKQGESAASNQLEQMITNDASTDESNEALKNEDSDDGDTGADEFDMFSGSVSPPSRAPDASRVHDNDARSQKVDQQQDWDDVEGYYKATIGELLSLVSIQEKHTLLLNS